ncbi:MAG: hypothetical protein NTW71_14345 [Deltaproteobacteria bacterium]|nr:hypothetical protein [Deltaproteobacteria bacterium]
MELMGYDALNLGSPELHFGKEFLEHTRSHVSFPYIASNLLFDGGSRLPWIRDYIIKEAGGIKVAILGIFDPDGLEQLPKEQVKGLKVIPPETALKRLLPEVREKADLVILLSRFDVPETIALVKAVKGIDVAISSGNDNIHSAEDPENTVILQTGALGKTMGLLKITLDEKRALRVSERRYVPMGNSVPGNGEIERLVVTFKKVQEKKDAELAKKQQEKLMEVLKLSPQEFMERFRQEQMQEQMRKGEAR